MSHLTESLPFSVYEDDVPKEETHEADGINEEMEGEKHRRHHITDRTRLSNRIVDLRTATSQAIFRVNSGICNIFRYYLDSQGFIEVHTPKLQGGATESGASVFQLDYFGRPAFLAQSPQLAKQMCISADFERVYEIGPVFRAENSNTHRHLTEYTGLDLEMAIDEHYHEALQLIDDMLKHIWKGIYRRFGRELEVIKRQFPHEDLIWLDETPRIPFSEGVRLLRDSGWTGDDGNPPSEYEDLSTRAEIRLGQLVKEKFHTDYYILDKFPVSARPFYTMPDPDNNKITNSFDIFLRGQEIISGGQRIHDAKMLENQMAEQGVKREGMEDYLEGFRWGGPPHAGCGIGLERLVMLFLNLVISVWLRCSLEIQGACLPSPLKRSFDIRKQAHCIRHGRVMPFQTWRRKSSFSRSESSLQTMEMQATPPGWMTDIKSGDTTRQEQLSAMSPPTPSQSSSEIHSATKPNTPPSSPHSSNT